MSEECRMRKIANGYDCSHDEQQASAPPTTQGRWAVPTLRAVGEGTWCPVAVPGSSTTRHTRTGVAMFFSSCSPTYSYRNGTRFLTCSYTTSERQIPPASANPS